MKKSMWAMLVVDNRKTLPPVVTADLTGKTVVVTGANIGLGYEAAIHLARNKPGKLILACRNKEKGDAAVAKIKEETGFQAELWLLDLGKFSSVIAFADKFEKEGGRLDILVANAAIATFDHNTTSEGWEESLQVNNISTSLLCILLAPRLVQTAKDFGVRPRIVVVGSCVHHLAKFDKKVFDAPNFWEKMNSKEYSTPAKMQPRYNETKLLNVFFIRSLQDVLKGTNVVVNTVNPGYCYSGLRKDFQGFMATVDHLMEKMLARTSEQGGRQIVYAAIGGKPDEVAGQYIDIHAVEEPADYVLGTDGKKRQDKIWVDLIEILAKVDGRVKTIVDSYSS